METIVTNVAPRTSKQTAVIGGAWLVFVHQLIRIARDAADSFGTYLLIGVTGMFAFQVFENIGMDVYMSPSTGITLPFVSDGGTSLVANFIAVGLCLSVSAGSQRRSFYEPEKT